MCWSGEELRGPWQWQARRTDRSTPSDVRVSDAERTEVIDHLSRQTGEGRLTLDEFEERVEGALRSTTRSELDSTLQGLPPVSPHRTRSRLDLRFPLRPLVAAALIALAILTLGAWVLWIVVPLAWCRVSGRHHSSWHRDRHDEPMEHDDLTLV